MTKATITIEIDAADAFFSERTLAAAKEGFEAILHDLMFRESEYQVNIEDAK
jgi:hypothetical protein